MVTQYALDELGNEYTFIYLWGKVSKNMSWEEKKKKASGSGTFTSVFNFKILP